MSRVTVRRALGELARERLIERRRSTGTRVIYRPATGADDGGYFRRARQYSRHGAAHRGQVDRFRLCAGGGRSGGCAWASAPDQVLQRSVRVRAVDGVPFSYLTTHVPERIAVTFSKQELASRPLLELLERAGVKVEHARQRISAGLATPDVAAGAGRARRFAADRAYSHRLRSIRPRRRASARALPARPLRLRNGFGALRR